MIFTELSEFLSEEMMDKPLVFLGSADTSGNLGPSARLVVRHFGIEKDFEEELPTAELELTNAIVTELPEGNILITLTISDGSMDSKSLYATVVAINFAYTIIEQSKLDVYGIIVPGNLGEPFGVSADYIRGTLDKFHDTVDIPTVFIA